MERSSLNELLKLWKERLRRFEKRPEVARGINSNVAMGVQHGRTMALKQCIEELEEMLNDSEKPKAK